MEMLPKVTMTVLDWALAAGDADGLSESGRSARIRRCPSGRWLAPSHCR
jgi:hypothetical protein